VVVVVVVNGKRKKKERKILKGLDFKIFLSFPFFSLVSLLGSILHLPCPRHSLRTEKGRGIYLQEYGINHEEDEFGESLQRHDL